MGIAEFRAAVRRRTSSLFLDGMESGDPADGLIGDVNLGIGGCRVARELDALVRIYGKPACVLSDNGAELTGKAILKWANDQGVSGIPSI